MILLFPAIILIAIAIILLSITIILKKDGKFPNKEISGNRHLRAKGLRCAKEEELSMWGRRGEDSSCKNCNGCGAAECNNRILTKD